MRLPPTEQLRYFPRFLKTIVWVVLGAFLNLTLQPLALAAGVSDATIQPATEADDDAKLEQTLEAIERKLEVLEQKLARKEDHAAEQAELRTLKEELLQLNELALQQFHAVEQQLKAEQQPQVILDRHYEAVAQYQSELGALLADLDAVEAAGDETDRKVKTEAAKKHLKEKRKTDIPKEPRDPNRLPFRTPDGKARQPKETKEEYLSLFKPEPIRLASMTLNAAMLTPVSAVAPTAADLAPSEDVQINPEIQTLAQSLGHNPVQIYQWVRNNIRFAPTFGSIQGSALCLQTRQCNAADTSSLLIALLRASNIPARYVYGNVQVSAAKVANWVTGVDDLNVALSMLGQGGIPNTALISGGEVVAVRLEHVWVEAYVDYHPSRGVINRQGDSWVPLDAAFKQYEPRKATDIGSSVQFDAQAYIAGAIDGAVIDEQEGRVQNINHLNVLAQLEDYQESVVNQLREQHPDLTLADVSGSRQIVPDASRVLAATLPYQVRAVGSRMSALPESLRHYATVSLYLSQLDRILDFPALAHRISLPALGSQRLGVHHEPATAADAQLLAGYVQQGATSLPLYLISVIPALQIDGVTVASGPAQTMGTKNIWTVTLSDPGGPHTGTESFDVTTGDEVVFGVNGGGVTQPVIDARFAQTTSDTAAENLHSVSLYFWMLHDAEDQVAANQFGIAVQRVPSVGMFAAPLQVRYFFGLPRSGSYLARIMDVKRVLVAASSNDRSRTTAFMKQAGMQGSYLEGAVFDLLFGHEQGTGVSAVRLLQEANERGMPIYRITQQNLALILPRLVIDSEARSDIVQAVNAGKEALVSEREIARAQWSGVGYIIQDPATGAGAYLIKGGLNGGAEDPCPSPQAEPVKQPITQFIQNLLWALLLAALIVAAIYTAGAAGPAVAAVLAMLGLAATPALAAAGPLPSGAQAVWDAFFSSKYGPFQPTGPYPGDGLRPPGTCGSQQYSALRQAQLATCAKPGTGACRNTKDCAQMQQYFDNGKACVDARLELMFTCFKGGDATHWGQVNSRLDGLADCLCRMKPGNCTAP